VGEIDYVTRVFSSPSQIAESAWSALLAREVDPSPFMRHEYLVAMHESGSARPRAGWQCQFVTLWRSDELQAACPMYLKNNSYGEYVFDWAWANAYSQHGLDYYPKALVAVPFTPVPGARLLARDAAARTALVKALIQQVRDEDLSSVHLLFAQAQDITACEQAGMMLRHTVQFHWKNEAPSAEGLSTPFSSFDHFLSSLQQEKRKKIRQERRPTFQTQTGTSSTAATNALTSNTATRPTSTATFSAAWRRPCRSTGCSSWPSAKARPLPAA